MALPPVPALRRALRVPLPVQSAAPAAPGPPRFLGYLANVSETGVFVQCTTPRPVGTRLALQLRLPGHDRHVLCDSAEIVWTRSFANTEEGSPGMGIRIVEIEPESRLLLRRFCEQGGPRGTTRISRG
jgi:uncharacterized protein (TIGR02266 family)